MNERPLDGEQERVQVGLAHAIADLPGKSGIELVFGDRFQTGSVLVGAGVFGIERHVDGHGGDGDLANLFPGHFEVRAAGLNHAHLRIVVPRFFFRTQSFRHGIVKGSSVARHADSAAESNLYGALALVHRIDTHHQDAQDEPRQESDKHSNQG